ncbi:MAG TPA: hypothetical protein VF624_18610 [Tepidisphaeraceae bacterium]
MKLLIDEQLPHRLRHLIAPHEAATVSYMGWNALVNGDLLRRAADAGFDVLITNDGNLPYEQNTRNLPCSVVILQAASNDLSDVALQVPGLLEILKSLPPRSVAFVPRSMG